jgi:hypothetical protein
MVGAPSDGRIPLFLRALANNWAEWEWGEVVIMVLPPFNQTNNR